MSSLPIHNLILLLQGDALTPPSHYCVTQKYQNHGQASLCLGHRGKICIYTVDAVVPYYIDRQTFETAENANTVESCIQRAIELWQPVPVRFEQVSDSSAAYFSVVSSKTGPAYTYAEAFFPGDRSRSITIYPLAFRYAEALPNILAHELGHVLGLRHEHAPENEADHCVLYGPRNPSSVMRYYDNPLEMAVHWLDTEVLATFYFSFYNNCMFKGLPVFFIDPTNEDS